MLSHSRGNRESPGLTSFCFYLGAVYLVRAYGRANTLHTSGGDAPGAGCPGPAPLRCGHRYTPTRPHRTPPHKEPLRGLRRSTSAPGRSACQESRVRPPLTRGAERCAPRGPGSALMSIVRGRSSRSVSLAPLVNGARAASLAPAFLAGRQVSQSGHASSSQDA